MSRVVMVGWIRKRRMMVVVMVRLQTAVWFPLWIIFQTRRLTRKSAAGRNR